MGFFSAIKNIHVYFRFNESITFLKVTSFTRLIENLIFNRLNRWIAQLRIRNLEIASISFVEANIDT